MGHLLSHVGFCQPIELRNSLPMDEGQSICSVWVRCSSSSANSSPSLAADIDMGLLCSIAHPCSPASGPPEYLTGNVYDMSSWTRRR